MNQILSTEPPREDRKNKKSNGPTDIKKIIIFFAIAIIIFGLIITGFSMYKTYNKNKQIQKEPSIAVEQREELAILKIECTQGISQLEYYFNEEEKAVEPQTGTQTIDKGIDIPVGVNKLTVIITDTEGKVFSKEFAITEIEGSKSIIEITPAEDGAKIKIVAENEEGLKYIKYRLNDGEEIEVKADVTTPNTIEITVDIDNLEIGRGENTIKVLAVDLKDKEIEETKTIKGQNEPVINVLQNGSNLDCEITHDMGFEKIEFNLNGQVFAYDENYNGYDETIKVFKTSVPLQQGENRLIITAYSLEGTTKTYKGKLTVEL